VNREEEGREREREEEQRNMCNGVKWQRRVE
jgi:hypothetical protein